MLGETEMLEEEDKEEYDNSKEHVLEKKHNLENSIKNFNIERIEAEETDKFLQRTKVNNSLAKVIGIENKNKEETNSDNGEESVRESAQDCDDIEEDSFGLINEMVLFEIIEEAAKK